MSVGCEFVHHDVMEQEFSWSPMSDAAGPGPDLRSVGLGLPGRLAARLRARRNSQSRIEVESSEQSLSEGSDATGEQAPLSIAAVLRDVGVITDDHRFRTIHGTNRALSDLLREACGAARRSGLCNIPSSPSGDEPFVVLLRIAGFLAARTVGHHIELDPAATVRAMESIAFLRAVNQMAAAPASSDARPHSSGSQKQ